MDFMTQFFGSLLALATLASIFSEGLSKLILQIWNVTLSGWKASGLALLSSFIAVGVGAFANIGMFGLEDFSPFADWQLTLIMGIGIWISAKGVFSLEVLQQILAFLKIKVPAPTTPPDNG